MFRRFSPPLAASFAVTIVLALPAVAGNGSGSQSQIPVRIKNVGSAAVAVNAKSGSVALNTLVSSARTLAPNGIAGINVKSGSFTALAANPSAPQAVHKVRSFETRTFKTIYLYAQQDTTRATIVGAPGGVKF